MGALRQQLLRELQLRRHSLSTQKHHVSAVRGLAACLQMPPVEMQIARMGIRRGNHEVYLLPFEASLRDLHFVAPKGRGVRNAMKCNQHPERKKSTQRGGRAVLQNADIDAAVAGSTRALVQITVSQDIPPAGWLLPSGFLH